MVYQFTVESIHQNAPDEPGVYLIYKPSIGKLPGTNIYVGESGNIFRRLMEHCKGQSRESKWCILKHAPTHFVYEIVYEDKLVRLRKEKEWITKYGLLCFGVRRARRPTKR